MQRQRNEQEREGITPPAGKHISPGSMYCDADHALKHVQTQDASFLSCRASARQQNVRIEVVTWMVRQYIPYIPGENKRRKKKVIDGWRRVGDVKPGVTRFDISDPPPTIYDQDEKTLEFSPTGGYN